MFSKPCSRLTAILLLAAATLSPWTARPSDGSMVVRPVTRQAPSELAARMRLPVSQMAATTPTGGTPAALAVIKTEDFDGTFPNEWTVFDNNGYDGDGSGGIGGEQYWIDDSTRSYSGGWSGWAAGGGLNGIAGGENYANDMDSWMVYGPFSLAGASSASASLFAWLDLADAGDYLALLASADNISFNGIAAYGPAASDWTPLELDLGALGLLGEEQVWFALVFSSDTSGTAGGAYVDDILVTMDDATPDFDFDLQVIDALDGVATPGGTTTVHTEVQNIDVGDSGGWGIDYYLSLDTTINNGDIYMGSLVGLPALAPDEVWSSDVVVPVPGVADGPYYVGAIIPTVDSNAGNNDAHDPVPIELNSDAAILVRPTSLNLQSDGAGATVAATAASAEALAGDTEWGSPADVARLQRKAESEGEVRLLVGLDVPFIPEGKLTAAARQSQRQAIGAAQDAVASSLRGFSHRVKRRFGFIPYMALSAGPRALQALAAHPMVRIVVEDRVARPLMESSNQVIASPMAWLGGYDGSGQAVAVLDTGVDTAHPWFTTGGSRIVAEACYSSNGGPDASLCPGGAESSTAVGSGANCSGIPGCDHGTHVAGTVAGNDGAGPDYGVARGADLIAMQVFTEVTSVPACGDPSPCLLSYDSDQIAALERVAELSASMDIAAVNMSLGGSNFSNQANCDALFTGEPVPKKDAIDSLLALGIATVIATGNDAQRGAISEPGCISSAVSVGATTDSDAIASFSNVAEFIDLLAPGTSIRSSIPGGLTGTKQGTSMATPHVAGAWAVLKQYAPDASVAQVLTALKDTGTIVDDSRASGTVTGMRRINLDLALQQLGYLPSEFAVFSTGHAPLNVTAITPSIEAPWLSFVPDAPFSLAPGEMQAVDVIVDWESAPLGVTDLSLFIDNSAPSGGEDQVDRTVYLRIANAAGGAAPVADPQDLNTPEDTSLPLTLTGSDADEDPLQFFITAEPLNGFLEPAEDEGGDGSAWTYHPYRDYHGPDSFQFAATDGVLESPPATVTITVTPRNDPPTFGTLGDRVHLPGTSGAQSTPAWVTAFIAGPEDETEAGQLLADYLVEITSDPLGVLVPSSADVLNDGTLEYELTGASGVATFTVAAQDDGGTDNGGQDTSTPQAFTVNVMFPPQGKLDVASYGWLIHSPALFDPAEPCCFDYDGDETPDDAWGDIAALAAGFGIDANAELAAQIEAAQVVKLAFWSGLPALGDAGAFALEFGSGAWQGTDDFPTRVAGQGEFSYDSNGLPGQPPNTISAVTDAAGNITGIADDVVSMPLVAGPEGILDVPLGDVQVAGTWSNERLDCDGVCTEDEPHADPPIKGGLRLGGLMHLDDYYGALDAAWQSCACDGGSGPIFEFGEGLSSYTAGCTARGDDLAINCLSCEGLQNLCTFAPLTVTFADIDSNDNGVADSFSVGVRIGLSGATIVGCTGDSCPGTEPPGDDIFADGFEGD